MSNATIVSNLEALLAAVEAQPESQFDLSYFRHDSEDENVCGTLFCTVGLACTMPRFQAEGYELIATPKNYDPGKFTYHVEVHGTDVRDSDASDAAFGTGAWFSLFTPAGDGLFDTDLGYKVSGDDYEGNMTDKELAILRLKKQIDYMKGEQA